MKQILYFFYIVLYISISNTYDVFGQSKFKAGPITGFGICSIHGNYEPDFKINGHVGFLTNYSITKKLHLQPQLLLTNKGYRYPQNSSDIRLKLTYIDLIVNLKYQVWNTLFVGLGFQSGWLINSKYIYLSYGTDYYDTLDIDIATNKIDLGINSCLGFQFRNGIGLEFSFLYGMRDIFNENSTNQFIGERDDHPRKISSSVKGQNAVISTSFYYLFGKSTKDPITE